MSGSGLRVCHPRQLLRRNSGGVRGRCRQSGPATPSVAPVGLRGARTLTQVLGDTLRVTRSGVTVLWLAVDQCPERGR